MPLDLVGKLHRTVYITGCPEDAQEDLLRMFLKRCGVIEGWDVVEGRIIVVFQSMNSVSNAVTFNGLSFVDLTKKICVWRATEAPPAEALQQLAIQGSSPPEDTAATLLETEEESDARRAQRQERRAALQEILSRGDAKIADATTPEGRQAKLQELSYRQLKALCILSVAAVRDAKEELVKTKENLARLQELIRSQQPGVGRGEDHKASGAGSAKG